MFSIRAGAFILAVLLFSLSAAAGVYYVDKNHAQAGDNKPGNESEPWASVKKAATTAGAGDTVYVKNGTYFERVVFKKSGTPSAYITFTAFPGHTPVINGRDNAQWNGLVNFSGVDYIRFSNITVTNCGTGQAIYIIHNDADTAYHIELSKLTISHVDDSPIQVRGNAAHILVEACTLHTCGASPVDASGFDGGRPHHVTIRKNLIYKSDFGGVGSEKADNLIVEDNTIDSCVLGIDVGSGKNNIIRNNHIKDCENGIALSSNTDSKVHDNSVENSSEALFAYYWSHNGEPHKNNKWYNNVVDNATWAIFEMNRKNSKADTGPTTGHEYYNNVFRNVGGNSYRSHQIRYYGWYSNKSRGMRRKREARQWDPLPLPLPEPPKRCSATWAMMIKHVYEVDPLTCPNCGEQMRVVSLIETRQVDVVQRILKHCGLWTEPPPRSPPQEPAREIVREPFYDDWVMEQVEA